MGAFTDGTYLAEVNAAGQSDLIRITSGQASLTGIALKVGQENGNGGYVLNHDYTIVETGEDRKSVVEGKSVSVRVDRGGRRFIKKKQTHLIDTSPQTITIEY